jgi:hypothetical protein
MFITRYSGMVTLANCTSGAFEINVKCCEGASILYFADGPALIISNHN